jgi:hypothetical protein
VVRWVCECIRRKQWLRVTDAVHLDRHENVHFEKDAILAAVKTYAEETSGKKVSITPAALTQALGRCLGTSTTQQRDKDGIMTAVCVGGKHPSTHKPTYAFPPFPALEKLLLQTTRVTQLPSE